MMHTYFQDSHGWIRGQAMESDVGAWLAIIAMLQARAHDTNEEWLKVLLGRFHSDILEAFDLELENRAQPNQREG